MGKYDGLSGLCLLIFRRRCGSPYDVLNIRLGNFILARLHRGVLSIINSFIGQPLDFGFWLKHFGLKTWSYKAKRGDFSLYQFSWIILLCWMCSLFSSIRAYVGVEDAIPSSAVFLDIDSNDLSGQDVLLEVDCPGGEYQIQMISLEAAVIIFG